VSHLSWQYGFQDTLLGRVEMPADVRNLLLLAQWDALHKVSRLSRNTGPRASKTPSGLGRDSRRDYFYVTFFVMGGRRTLTVTNHVTIGCVMPDQKCLA
jgi:hypothetical protein